MIDRFNFKKVFAMRKLVLAVFMMFWSITATSRDFVGNVSVPMKVDLTKESLLKKSLTQSLAFIENKGQITDQHNKPRHDIQFKIAAAPGLNIFIGEGAIHYQFSKPDKEACPPAKEEMMKPGYIPEDVTYTMYRMDVELINANKHAQVVTEEKQGYYENYFTGNCGKNGAIGNAFNRITYKEVYPNIDWVLYVSRGQLKHEFVVRDGGKASDIKLNYGGATHLKIDNNGNLAANTPQGVITENAPYTYQKDGKKIASGFKLDGDVLSYTIGEYSGDLVIDPSLLWATYYGGITDDFGEGVAEDGTGNVYMIGLTNSSSSIATSGAYQTAIGGGGYDVFLVKFNSLGLRQWATYYGGGGQDIPYGIATDVAGDIYITGRTFSTSGISTPGAYHTAHGGGKDAFLAKFSNSGGILWATYFGSSNDDDAFGVATDVSGNVYISGDTRSTSAISTSSSYQTTYGGGGKDGYLAKFNSSGAIQWATYYGGSNDDGIIGVATDGTGNVYISGYTISTSAIASSGAFQSTYGGGQDAFLVKFNSSGARQWATYYGGAGYDEGNGVVTDGAGNVYITGFTQSSSAIATSGAYQTTFGGGNDAFLAKLNSSGVMQWATYYGGTGSDGGTVLATDLAGNIYMSGFTNSTTAIATSGAYQTAYGGGADDAYLVQFNTTGSVQWATYFGGSNSDVPRGVATDGFGNVYMTGGTTSTSAIATSGAYQTTFAGGGFGDAFLAKFNFCTPPIAGTITGSSNTYVGSSIALTNTTPGGTWSSGSTSIASVGSTGIVTGVATGTALISYSVTNSCGTAVATTTITVTPCPPIISTIAGNGTVGYSGDGGPATSGTMSYPTGVAIDNNGNVYIADNNSNRIRKVNTLGIITTSAGTGTAGFSGDGGAATSAQLNRPYGVAVDAIGNLYITDDLNYRIRKVSQTGIITTIAGNGTAGFSGDGGAATSGSFNGANQITIDRNGNIFFSDFFNNRIRKVSTSGIISTVAGNGTAGFGGDGGQATAGMLSHPAGVAVDNIGNIYIADNDNDRIRKVNTSGIITTIAGTGTAGFSGDGGAATSAQLSNPSSISVDASRTLFFTDQNNQRLRKINTTGTITTIVGNGTAGYSGDGGPATSAALNNPYNVAIDGLGNLYIADYGNSAIRKIMSTLSAGSITGASSVSVGSAITLTNIATGGTWSSSNPSLATVASTGIVTGVSPGVDTISYSVTNTCGTAVATKVVTVTPLSVTACNGITTFAGNGTMGYSGDGGAATAGMLSGPAGVAIDNSGNVYISDISSHYIRKVNTSGVITTIAGNGTAGFSGDGGPATAAQLNGPHALAIDANGNLYVGEFDNHSIRKVSTTGIISTIAGTGSPGHTGDGGPATLATFTHPYQIAIDNSGNIFFADYGNNNIRKISVGGIISTVAGDGTHGFYGDGGPATAAAMRWPTGVAVDGVGNLYIGDYRNQRIRFVNAAGIISTIAGPGISGISGDGGPATAASVSPHSVTVDVAGNLYIADGYAAIRQIDTAGVITTVAGIYGSLGYSGDGGPATAAELDNPFYIDIDIMGNLYFADGTNHVIRKVVLPLSARSILGPSSVSVGSAITLSITAGGGSWSSSNPSIATVGSTGMLTGISAGIDTISYTVTNACGSVVATKVVTVHPFVPSLSCGTITTVAGSGTSTSTSGDGGQATSATMGRLFGLARDGAGNIYISDFTNNRIRKIEPSGVITTFAGTGAGVTSGDGGPATAAGLNGPSELALHGNNLYIAEHNSSRVRKVDIVSGIITTYAGTGSAGYSGDGGPATAAQISHPYGLGVDNSGNVYIPDEGTHRIRKVNASTGIITTFVGTGVPGNSGDGGPATAATIELGDDIKCDTLGNIFFCDFVSNVVRKVNASGIISTIAGTGVAGYSGDGGPATAAKLLGPCAVLPDVHGNIYICDADNHRVRLINPFGIISTIAGTGTAGFSGDGGPAIMAELFRPNDMIFDSLGDLYFCDIENHRVRKISNPVAPITGLSTVTVGSTITLSSTTTGGTWSSSNASIATVGSTGIVTGISAGIATISYIVIAACGTSVATKVVTVTASSVAACNGITTFAGNGTMGYSGDGGAATAGMLSNPAGVAIDNNGDVYIADQRNNCIRKVNASGVITTFAGTGIAGFSGDGGPATSAQLNMPHALAIDANGNLIIADEYNYRIRKVSTTGIISTIAGTGSWVVSGDGGPATAAAFGHVFQIAIDNNGNIFFADQRNNNIRKISAGGIISTVAGDGTHAFYGDGGPATAAAMKWPSGIAVDGGGNLYIADSRNQRVRFVSAAGIISTIAGNGIPGSGGDGGAATAANVSHPESVAVDVGGNLYICDANSSIRKIDSSGIITTIAGNGTSGYSGDGGPATAAELSHPYYIDIDILGNMYVVDEGSSVIRKVVLPLPARSILGSSSVSVGSAIALSINAGGGTWSSSNSAVATVGSTGIVTGVSPGLDTINYTVTNACGSAVATKVVTVTASSGSSCSIITTIAGSGTGMGYSGDGGPATAALMSKTYGMARDAAGNIYVTDFNNNRIRKIDPSGIITTYAGNGTAAFSGDGGPATAASLHGPVGLAIYGSTLYFCDNINYRVRKIDATGIISTIAGNGVNGYGGDGGPATSAQISRSNGVAVDGSGDVYITDLDNARVRKIGASGIISTVVGSGISGYSGDGGPATLAQLDWPDDIKFDAAGNLYFCDFHNNAVRKVDTSGIITTIAGTGIPGFSGDGGPASAAKLLAPCAVLPDTHGNIYISDADNHRIRLINPSGIISTIAGIGTPGFSGDNGPALSAEVNRPNDMIFDATGNLYFCDIENHRVRKIALSSLSVSSISGPSSVCNGSTITLSDSTAGGVWSSLNAAVATVGSTGIVTGLGLGTTTISYTVTNACGTLSATKTITVTASPGSISGATSVCTGDTINLSNATPGGTWTSSSTSIATVGSSTGVVTGNATGNVVITYSLGASCQATTTINVLSLPAVPSISGGTSLCIGLTTLLSNSMPGGFWYSTDASKATVSSSGLVTGISGGFVAIVYAVANSCGIGFNSVFVNVSSPTPISGVPSVCIGATTTLSHSSPGGTWTSGNPLIATVGSSSGIVTGVALGNTTITYAMGPGCFSTISVTVNASGGAITGPGSLCVSMSGLLTASPSGGTWSSSPTSIATVAPSGLVTGVASGTATITYSIIGGCYATKTVSVTTTGGPITGTAGVCRGFTTTLIAPMPGGIWSSASTFYATVGSTTGIVYGASPGTSLITYSVGTGCTSTITVTVRPVPAIMTVIGGGTFCAGGPGVNVGLPGSAVGINYQLYLGGVPVGSPLAGTGSSLSFGLQTITGVYTVRAIDPVTLCQSNMIGGATVTAYPLPIIGVSPGVSICSGGSTMLTGSGGISYTWLPGTGLTSTAGSVVNAHPVTTTTYTVTGTNSSGCSNTATVTVTVNPLPTISAGPGVAICSGSSTTLIASGGANYTWSPATGLSATTGTTVVAYPTTTRTYTVTGISGSGCISRATVTVTVSSLPGIVACPGVAICYGASATLSASGGATYEWSPPVALSATTGASIVASPTVTTTYTVTGTNGTGCSNRATVTVTVNSLPTISTSSGGAVCNGSSTTLSSSGGVSYTWTPPIGLSATTGASITASPSVTTTYTVTGTNGNGCTNRATVTATVNTSPSAISTTGNLCVGNSVTLTNATSGGVWSSSNPSIATIGSSTGVVTGVASGTTTISYTLSSGCRAIMIVTVAALPSAISGPGTIYTGATATYTNATSGGFWTSSNTSIVSIGSATGIATGVAAGAATLSYTVSSGCRTTLLVSVSATPTVFSVTGGGIYCYGGAAVVIGLSNSQAGVSYQLYRGGTPVGTPVSGTGGAFSFGTFTTAGTYTVIANPSSSSPVTMSGSATVTVISSTMLPPPSAVLGGGTMCAGSPGLPITMPGSAVTVDYQLYRNGILTGSPLPGIGTAMSFGLHTVPGTYTVIATSTVNGCSRNIGLGVNITVFPTPNVYNVTGGGSFCSGVGGVVVGLNNSQSGVNYQLYNGTSAVGSLRPGTGAAFNFSTVTASGTYSVVGIGSYCTANMSGTATVSANPVPTVSGTIYTVAPAGSISLSGSVSGGLWTSSNTGVATIGSSSGIVTGVALGSSTISYTLFTGCRGTKVIYVTPTGHRGIADDSSTDALFARRVYVRPNPNTGTFWVRGDFGDDVEATLEVFNMLGQKVYSRVVRLQDGKLEEEILLENITNGTYLLNVSSATYRDMFHVVVAR